VVPDNHALEEFSAVLLCDSKQTIIWGILLVISVPLIEE